MTNKAGRPAAPTPTTELPPLNEERVAEAVAAQDILAAASDSIEEDALNASVMLGAAAALRATALQSAAYDLVFMARVKERKVYRALRGKTIQLPGGRAVTVDGTWEGFCAALGLARQDIDERIAGLQALGPEMLRACETAGMTRRQLREVRALPMPKRAEVAGRVFNAQDAGEVRDVLDDVLADQAATEKALAEARAELQAKDELIDKKNKKIDALDAKLSAKRRHQLDEASEARAAMCESVAEQATEITKAAARLGELLAEAAAADMLMDVPTQETVYRSVHNARRAFDALYERAGVMDVDDPQFKALFAAK